MLDIIKIGITFIAVLSFYLFLSDVFSASAGASRKHKKRMKELRFQSKRTSSDDGGREFIDKVTSPVSKYIVPRINTGDEKQLAKDLEMAQWIGFTPTTFIAMDITLKIIGLVAFCALAPIVLPFGIFVGALFMFLFKFLFKNSISERRFRLLSEFPEFIEIASGFLKSGMSLTKAIERSMEYVGEEWKPILEEFYLNCATKGESAAINEMKDKVDIFEVKEFWSLIKLNTNQGVDMDVCFAAQSEKIKELQMEVMLGKIRKRETMSMAIQGPLLLNMILTFGLPTFNDMLSLGI